MAPFFSGRIILRKLVSFHIKCNKNISIIDMDKKHLYSMKGKTSCKTRKSWNIGVSCCHRTLPCIKINIGKPCTCIFSGGTIGCGIRHACVDSGLPGYFPQNLLLRSTSEEGISPICHFWSSSSPKACLKISTGFFHWIDDLA